VEIESLFGLPAHPLVVHAAVVLLPLAVLSTLVAAVVPRQRMPYAIVALGLAVAATGAVALAQGSGEALEERVTETPLVEEHTQQGERVLPWAAGLTVVAAAVLLADPVRRRYPRLTATQVTAALLVLTVGIGAGATWSIVEVGHSGAKATWDDLPAKADD
jgi:uncharacterized membrane protein